MPFAKWVHSSRYILIDAATGNYQIQNKRFFPPDWKTNFSVISERPRPTPIALPANEAVEITRASPNPNLFAVIIVGESDERFKNDASAIYCALINTYGYTKENIFVHAVTSYDMDGDDDEYNDFDYFASKDAIEHTFNELAGETNTSTEIPKLEPSDQLFIFVTSHGGMDDDENSYIILPDNDPDELFDYDMADYLENAECSQIIGVFAICEAGGFYNKLQDCNDALCKNRSIHTSSNTESSWWEYWITNGNYDEFVYYWTAAVRGYPYSGNPYEVYAAAGSFPFHYYFTNHLEDYNPDINEDGVVQMSEAFDYANNMDTWSEYGYYNPNSNTGSSGDEPDDFVPEVPLEYTDISFEEDLLSLAGIQGLLGNGLPIENRNYMIGGLLAVDDDLTIPANSHIYLTGENGEIDVLQGTSLIIEDNVTLAGNNTNKISVNGSIQIGNNAHFSDLNNAGFFGGLDIYNQNASTTLNQATFTKTKIHNYGDILLVNNCVFDACYIIYSHRGTVTYSNSDFSRTWLYIENTEENNKIATVSNCNFTTDVTMVAIDIWNYDNYRIENNTMNGFYNGIQLYQSGDGNLSNYHHIHNNEIFNSSTTGIAVYGSKASISMNHIHNNNTGIRLNNKCNVSMYGAYNATSYNEMNYITNNDNYELYISKYSFPWYFRYNAIIDDDNIGNPSDPLLYFAYPTGGKINQKDIRYNCWTENNNFVATEDLYPYEFFTYSPTWCPNGSPIPIELAEQMYIDGKEQFDDQQYLNSKATFQLLIDQYPKTKYAESAMKELINTEKFSTNDYSSLKEYFLTADSIVLDTNLASLATRLVNVCEIKLGNYQEAINYFEATIINPETLEDSIFAIIDLGYVYFLMENEGDKSNYSGRLIEFKPESKSQFFEHRDFLLSLIPEEKMSNTLKGNIDVLEAGELLQNIPNPFNGTTKIYYKLKAESNIKLNVYNYTGQLINTYKEGIKTNGIHYIDFDAGGLKNGIYLYSISINGQITDSKKMTIMK